MEAVGSAGGSVDKPAGDRGACRTEVEWLLLLDRFGGIARSVDLQGIGCC